MFARFCKVGGYLKISYEKPITRNIILMFFEEYTMNGKNYTLLSQPVRKWRLFEVGNVWERLLLNTWIILFDSTRINVEQPNVEQPAMARTSAGTMVHKKIHFQ